MMAGDTQNVQRCMNMAENAQNSKDLRVGEPIRKSAKMAQQIKVLFAEPDDLSSIPRIHMA